MQSGVFDGFYLFCSPFKLELSSHSVCEDHTEKINCTSRFFEYHLFLCYAVGRRECAFQSVYYFFCPSCLPLDIALRKYHVRRTSSSYTDMSRK